MPGARVLVVDDEVLARRRLLRLLAKRGDAVDVIGECRDGGEAVEAIRRDRVDVVFLDVQMPGLDGVGVLETVGFDAVGAVVFVTAYDRYAIRAFDLHAIDYLLKPFSDRRFDQALERALTRLRRNEAEALSEALMSAVANYRGAAAPRADRPTRLSIRSAGKVRLVEFEEIDWVEASGAYVRLHVGEKSLLVRSTMKAMQERLPSDLFLRVHRSTIVNVHRVVEMHPFSHRELLLILRDGTRLKLSRSYRERAEAFFSFLS